MSKEPPAVTDEPTDRPQPEPIRFYGTSWVDHSRMYTLRRFALGLGAVLLTVCGVVVLRVAYAGLQVSDAAAWLNIMAVVAFAICSSMAFTRTWSSYVRPMRGRADELSFRSIKVIGFLGVLLAYAMRSAYEAPGEKLLRRDYETAVEQHDRLHSKRTGNPARRKKRRS
ncbi:hypothetical protein PJ985_03770 [Streptomyces sp. ACA25]|uniref:hypothetical protein n=1 Tax=Streptomyces sp. ACA25 TaxID=3022596 RepID=UPI0023080CEF|nr:hypothetical protein [Streptomyces sp. ACA25]MDB1086685.1 hypothetical protein [Streptomyces sp. ACA25]